MDVVTNPINYKESKLGKYLKKFTISLIKDLF